MVTAGVLLFAQMSAFAAIRPCTTCTAASPQSSTSAEVSAVAGTVRDIAGGVVPGASVIVRAAGREQQTTTGADGRFSAGVSSSSEIVLVVRAAGFADLRQTISAGASRTGLEIVLSPATVVEAVT